MDELSKQPEKSAQKFGVPKARDRVLEALSQAYVDRQLETDDYEKRVELAYKARTLDDLEDAVYDFPNRSQIIQRPQQQYASPRRNSNTAFPSQGPQETVVTVIGDRKLSEIDFDNHPVHVIHGIGDLTVDLRSIKDGQHIELNQFSLIGDTKILVPSGMQVRRKNFMYIIGEFRRRKRRDLAKFLGRLMGQKNEPSEEPMRPPTDSVLVIKGFKLIGDVTVVDH